MKTTRRILLAGLAGFAVAPATTPAFAATQTDVAATVAEERFARMIAAAHAPDVTCARQAERYADRIGRTMSWRPALCSTHGRSRAFISPPRA